MNGDDWRWVLFGTLAAIVIIVVAALVMMPIAHAETPCHGTEGIASWYGAESGHRTANGEPFPTREATAASRTLPFNTRVRVVDQRTGRSVVVRIDDVGPAAWTHRLIDLSPVAARELGILDEGLSHVCVTPLFLGAFRNYITAAKLLV